MFDERILRLLLIEFKASVILCDHLTTTCRLHTSKSDLASLSSNPTSPPDLWEKQPLPKLKKQQVNQFRIRALPAFTSKQKQ